MREILSHFCDADTICAIAGGLCCAFYGDTGFTDEIFEEYSVDYAVEKIKNKEFDKILMAQLKSST